MAHPKSCAVIRMNREIKLIISDFDGTLVDTQEANFLAYRDVLKATGYELTFAEYAECFGLRFDEFMRRLGISDVEVMKNIRIRKAEVYPRHFHKIKINRNLVCFIESFRRSRGKTALASTAARRNLDNVLAFTGLNGLFDLIVSGDEIKKPKPDPSCYLQVMKRFNIQPHECLIFEDAPVGIEAAAASGAGYIIVKEFFYGN